MDRKKETFLIVSADNLFLRSRQTPGTEGLRRRQEQSARKWCFTEMALNVETPSLINVIILKLEHDYGIIQSWYKIAA